MRSIGSAGNSNGGNIMPTAPPVQDQLDNAIGEKGYAEKSLENSSTSWVRVRAEPRAEGRPGARNDCRMGR